MRPITSLKKLNPNKAAQRFILKRFPDCQGALLAGSIVRGEATETSDLDIIIFDANVPFCYRESLVDFGWNIELFVHNLETYKQYFKSDFERARPSLPRMVSEGMVLKDEGMVDDIKKEANLLLENGPQIWSSATIDFNRYFITDALDDFIGSDSRAEEIFIANTLAELLSEFVLRTNKKWVGTSKWIFRSLRNYDEEYADQFVRAFDEFYKSGEKQHIIKLVDKGLEPYGGRLFEGFSVGKRERGTDG